MASTAECHLAHPHGYFACSDTGTLYVRRYKSPVFGWTGQIHRVCAAHRPTLENRYCDGERETYTPIDRELERIGDVAVRRAIEACLAADDDAALRTAWNLIREATP